LIIEAKVVFIAWQNQAGKNIFMVLPGSRRNYSQDYNVVSFPGSGSKVAEKE
jgi:hypothetical protein